MDALMHKCAAFVCVYSMCTQHRHSTLDILSISPHKTLQETNSVPCLAADVRRRPGWCFQPPRGQPVMVAVISQQHNDISIWGTKRSSLLHMRNPTFWVFINYLMKHVIRRVSGGCWFRERVKRAPGLWGGTSVSVSFKTRITPDFKDSTFYVVLEMN